MQYGDEHSFTHTLTWHLHLPTRQLYAPQNAVVTSNSNKATHPYHHNLRPSSSYSRPAARAFNDRLARHRCHFVNAQRHLSLRIQSYVRYTKWGSGQPVQTQAHLVFNDCSTSLPSISLLFSCYLYELRAYDQYQHNKTAFKKMTVLWDVAP
jgi:hypothetical protein